MKLNVNVLEEIYLISKIAINIHHYIHYNYSLNLSGVLLVLSGGFFVIGAPINGAAVGAPINGAAVGSTFGDVNIGDPVDSTFGDVNIGDPVGSTFGDVAIGDDDGLSNIFFLFCFFSSSLLILFLLLAFR